jgi:hypothetical protein
VVQIDTSITQYIRETNVRGQYSVEKQNLGVHDGEDRSWWKAQAESVRILQKGHVSAWMGSPLRETRY